MQAIRKNFAHLPLLTPGVTARGDRAGVTGPGRPC